MRTTFFRGANGANATWTCPWCASHVTAPVRDDGVKGQDAVQEIAATWTIGLCPNGTCQRVTLFCGPHNLKQLHTAEFSATFPKAMPSYQPIGVSKVVATDFQEAKRCAAHGFFYGAALVGRRALQAACRELVGQKGTLQQEIEATNLPAQMKQFAHEVRLIGNDAAHCDEVTESDCGDLLEFTEQLLDILFVKPAQLAARRRP